jgi:hypothetical protein
LQREKYVGNANVRIPERVLLDDAYKLDVEHIWYQALATRASCEMQLAKVLKDWSEFFMGAAKKEINIMRKKEWEVWRALISLQRMQEKRLHCQWKMSKLKDMTQDLRKLQDLRAEFRFHKLASHWTQVGDKVTKEFFKTTRPKHRSVQLKQLEKPDGTLVKDPIELKEMVSTFYKDLLSMEEERSGKDAAKQAVLDAIPLTVSD